MKKMCAHKYKSINISSGYLQRFLDQLEVQKFSPRTIGVRRRGITDFMSYIGKQGIMRLQDISEDHLDGYRVHLSKRKLKVRTIENYLRSVCIFFSWLEEEQAIFINPAESLEYPKVDKMLQPVPSEQEMKMLLQQPDISKPTGIRDMALLETMYATGARLNEAWAITILDVDLDNHTVRLFGKFNKLRVVPLTTVAAKWLRKYMVEVRPKLLKDEEEARLWISRDGDRLSRISMQKLIEKYVRQSGIKTPVSAHGIRRAFATHMLAHGCHPMELQELMGHDDLRSLEDYIKIDIREIIEMHEESAVGQ